MRSKSLLHAIFSFKDIALTVAFRETEKKIQDLISQRTFSCLCITTRKSSIENRPDRFLVKSQHFKRD